MKLLELYNQLEIRLKPLVDFLVSGAVTCWCVLLTEHLCKMKWFPFLTTSSVKAHASFFHFQTITCCFVAHEQKCRVSEGSAADCSGILFSGKLAHNVPPLFYQQEPGSILGRATHSEPFGAFPIELK